MKASESYAASASPDSYRKQPMPLTPGQIEQIFRATHFHGSSDAVRWRVDAEGSLRFYVDADESFGNEPEDLEEITPETLDVFLSSMADATEGLDDIYAGDLYVARIRGEYPSRLNFDHDNRGETDKALRTTPRLHELFLAAANGDQA